MHKSRAADEITRFIHTVAVVYLLLVNNIVYRPPAF